MKFPPNLSTSTDHSLPHPSRSSCQSCQSSTSPLSSTRNSYSTLQSSIPTASTRTSYDSMQNSHDTLNRISSFSRTSRIFDPPSLSSSPGSSIVSSRESSPEPPLTCENDDTIVIPDQIPFSAFEKQPQTYSKSETPNGPTALGNLKNVDTIVCVAFGAFDRYYIAWKDTSGSYCQESHKLPSRLHNWLFPTQGTRDFQTLQVSLGSHDEFFASDQYGKISSRDSILHSSSQASLQNLSSTMVSPGRRKAHTTSSISIPDDLFQSLHAPTPSTSHPKLERRKTDLFILRDYKTGESSKQDRRRSIIVGGVPMLQPRPTPASRIIAGKEKLQLQTKGIIPTKPAYRDVGIQTEKLPSPQRTESRFPPRKEPPIAYVYCQPRNPVPIGWMQDFCRNSYSLGDALGYV